MSWLLCLSVFLYAHVWVPLVSADKPLLFFDTFCYYGFRVIPCLRFCFVPLCLFEITALNSPAEGAALVAVDDGWRHLDALMASYAVELLLVAWTVAYEAFLQPSAAFYG